MTDPTGRSFLSYKRCRLDEARLLIEAQHDHGIPTWQDVEDLGTTHTEDTIRAVLDDPETANAVLLVTPEVAQSSIIRKVEAPKIVKRAEHEDEFFAVPIAAGGLGYTGASDAVSNVLSSQRLRDWNMHRPDEDPLTAADAVLVANRILTQRVRAIHRVLPQGESLRIGFFARRRPPFEPGVALALDWFDRFAGKEVPAEVWSGTLIPALSRVRDAIARYAPGRTVEAFGLPTLPAGVSFGQAFLSTGGVRASWRQTAPGVSDQVWSLDASREDAGFQWRFASKDPEARDLAVLVSIVDDVEPLFAAWQMDAAPVRTSVHVKHPAQTRFIVRSPGQACDIALTVRDAIRTARSEYGDIGTVHLFMAAPAGIAMLVGQLLNTVGRVQTYEHVGVDGSGCYRPAAVLHPCE